MKPILTIVAILFSFSAFSATPEFDQYMCITDFPTTSFFLNTEKTNMKFTLMHHNGIKFAPVFNGLATPYDIDHIKKSGDFAKKLGETIEVHFQQSDCARLSNDDISCFNNNETKIGDLVVENFFLLIYQSVTKSTLGEFSQKHARFQYRVSGRTYEIPMNYSSHECGPF